jgi:hypothetical protein
MGRLDHIEHTHTHIVHFTLQAPINSIERQMLQMNVQVFHDCLGKRMKGNGLAGVKNMVLVAPRCCKGKPVAMQYNSCKTAWMNVQCFMLELVDEGILVCYGSDIPQLPC